jgi:hypothetical protein
MLLETGIEVDSKLIAFHSEVEVKQTEKKENNHTENIFLKITPTGGPWDMRPRKLIFVFLQL